MKGDLNLDIVSWIIIGALAGWISSKITDNDKEMGALTNIIVGIIGAFIGGFIMNTLGGKGVTGFNLWSLFVSVIGSIVLLLIVNVFKKRKT